MAPLALVGLGLALLLIFLVINAVRTRARAPREYGYDVVEMDLGRYGALRYAQWRHPLEQPKFFDEALIDSYRSYIQEGDLAIDIGAHTGDTALPMAVAAGPNGCVLAFEPNRYVFKILEQNAALNADSTSIIPLPYAATEDDASRTFYYVDAAFCNGGYLATKEEVAQPNQFPLTVEGRNVATLLRNEYGKQLPRLSLLKVDTDGSDHLVLRSLTDILREYRPVVVTEVMVGLPVEDRESIFATLDQLDYQCFRRTEDGNWLGERVRRDDLMRWEHYDIVAIPQD